MTRARARRFPSTAQNQQTPSSPRFLPRRRKTRLCTVDGKFPQDAAARGRHSRRCLAFPFDRAPNQKIRAFNRAVLKHAHGRGASESGSRPSPPPRSRLLYFDVTFPLPFFQEDPDAATAPARRREPIIGTCSGLFSFSPKREDAVDRASIRHTSP